MIVQLEEFECNGHWMCSAVNLGRRNQWVLESRVWGKLPTDFVEMLIKEYKVSHISYDSDTHFCWWYWDTQSAMRKYKNATNALFRQKGYKF